jgi:hypothetical protein
MFEKGRGESRGLFHACKFNWLAILRFDCNESVHPRDFFNAEYNYIPNEVSSQERYVGRFGPLVFGVLMLIRPPLINNSLIQLLQGINAILLLCY